MSLLNMAPLQKIRQLRPLIYVVAHFVTLSLNQLLFFIT